MAGPPHGGRTPELATRPTHALSPQLAGELRPVLLSRV